MLGMTPPYHLYYITTKNGHGMPYNYCYATIMKT